jgi:phosphoglycolate phosphatase-like HAD superfamily hydrolase
LKKLADLKKTIKKQKDFFIGIDSDGCVFNSMEKKQMECFFPEFIKHFELDQVYEQADKAWKFVNLYSRSRGTNRFIALVRTLELLSNMAEITEKGVSIDTLPSLKKWTLKQYELSNSSLKHEMRYDRSPDLKKAYDWSLDVDLKMKRIIKGIPPFQNAVDCLRIINDKSDAIVISQTPVNAIEREWKENGIFHLVKAVCGQEMGPKPEQISFLSRGLYENDRILMIGDAACDLEAAVENNAGFFPIIPGQEEESWAELLNTGLKNFFSGKYGGKYEEDLIRNFEKHLPSNPDWKTVR